MGIFAVLFTILCLTVPVQPSKTSGTSFITSSCRATLYPTLCVKSLVSYAALIKLSTQKLTHTSLVVSLAKVKSTRAYISTMAKAKEFERHDREVLRDCLVNMEAAEDRIRGSVQEMERMGKGSTRRELRWRMSNVQTWVSAALTGENTCGDGLGDGGAGRRVSVEIGPMIDNVKQVTSNALALINKFVEDEY